MVIDTLEILIEGDINGLTTKFNQARSKMDQFISGMNDKSVNWESILSKSISPAIITGIAAMFANAIVQYTQFQQSAMNLNNIGSDSTKDFASSISSMGGAAYTLANSAGASIGDTTSAFEAFTKAGLESDAAMAAVIDSANIARQSGQSMGDVVSQLVDLFGNWGVTTLPQVTNALTGLVNASTQGKFSFNELVQTVSQSGNLLKGSTDITSIALSLQHMTSDANLSKGAVSSMFDTFLSGFADTSSNLNIFLGGMNAIKNTLGTEGLIPIFEKITDKVKSFGSNTGLAGQVLGISSQVAQIFGNTSSDALGKAAKGAELAVSKLTPLDKFFKDHESDVNKLSIAWNKFTTNLAELVIPKALDVLTQDVQGLNILFDEFKNKGISGVLQGIGEGLAQAEINLGNSVLSGVKGAINYFTGAPSSKPSATSTTSNSNTVMNNTFLVAPGTSGQSQADDITRTLYKKFNGTQ